MIRYATWTRRPEDPRTVWGWIFRREHRYGFADRRILGRVALFVLLVLGSVLGLYAAFGGGIHLVLIGAIPIALAALVTERNVDHRAHLGLPTLGEGIDAISVVLTLFDARGKEKKAEELGWLTLTEDWLVYEGMRTTFSLKPGSVVREGSLPDAIRLLLSDGRWVEFHLPSGERWRDSVLRIEALRAFEGELRLWLAQGSPTGEAIYPPREEHPSSVALRIRGRLIGGLALAVIAGVFAPLSLPFALLLLVCALGMIVGFFWGAADFRRRLPQQEGMALP